MKIKNIARIIIFFFICSLILTIPIIPVGANDNDQPIKDTATPITDISKAVPFSHSLDNTVNPKSPKYNPSDIYGLPGTRFGPPGQRTELSPLNSPTGVGHRGFGAGIIRSSNMAYAKHKFWFTICIPNGTALYAPTLHCSNYCPLEILSRYWYNNGLPRRSLSVYDHVTGQFVVNLDTPGDYLSNGEYSAEIILSQGSWKAMVYNIKTSLWEIFWSESTSASDPYGWDIWEEWYFNESNWPNLSSYPITARNIQIDAGLLSPLNGGNEQKDMDNAPYITTWYAKYCYWKVSQ